MNIVGWEPFREMDDMLARFDRFRPRSLLSREFGAPSVAASSLDWMPPVDITETDKAFRIEVELPQVDKKDVKIEVQDGHMSISGERKHETEEKGEKSHRIERYFGRFSRTFTLPENVNADKTKADYKDGVLVIKLPKIPGVAKDKARQIPVE